MSNPLTAIPLRAARWSATHPWRAILAWFVFVLLAVGLAMAVPTSETTDADYRLGESGRADALVSGRRPRHARHRERARSPRAATHRWTARRGDRRRRGRARRDARARRCRAGSPAPQWSPDRSALLVAVQLAAGPARTSRPPARRHRGACRPTTRAAGPGGRRPHARRRDQRRRSADDLSAAEGISLPVTLVLMLVAFGALIAAGIPVLLAATSVAATIGITAPLSHLVHAEPTVSSMIVLIGMAVGVDYSLFYLKREREERATPARSTLDAVEIAAQTSGHSILGRPACASSPRWPGSYVVGDATFNSLATGAILVVAIAVLGSITVLPALLVKLGRWVDRPRVPAAVAPQPPDRPGRHQPPHPRVRSCAARSPRWSSRARRRAALARAGAGHEDALGQPRHAARPRSRRCRPSRDMTEAFPVEGASRRGRRARASAGPRGPVARGARRDSRRDAVATGDFVDAGRDAGADLGGRHDLGARARHAVRRVATRGSTARSSALRDDLVPAGARRARRGARRGRRRGRVPRLRRPAARPAAAGDRLRAAADDGDDGRRVPQRAARARLDACSTWPRSGWPSA